MENTIGVRIFGYVFLAIVALMLAIMLVQVLVKKLRRAKWHLHEKTVHLPEVESVYDEEGFAKFYYVTLPRRQRIRNAEREVVLLDDEMRSLKERLAKVEAEMIESAARLNDLRAHEDDDAKPDKCTKRQIESEFAKIRVMSNVKQVQMVRQSLKIFVRAEYRHKECLYDLGDYEIRISSDGEFGVVRVRNSGYTVNLRLDERLSEICDYITTGRVADAVELVVQRLNHVSKDEREMVLKNCAIINKEI